MNDWLTVKESALEMNCSESAIKRIFYKLNKSGSDKVKKENGKIFLHRSIVQVSERLNDQANDGERPSERTNDQKEQIKESEYIKILDILQTELREKNIQIERLQIDNEQKNKIIMHLQTKLYLNAPNVQANDQANDGERPPTDQDRPQANDGERWQSNVLLFLAVLIVVLLVGILSQM